MEIQVVVTREKKPDIMSRLIMWWTKQEYSHILIDYYCCREKKNVIFHATGEGVNKQPSSEFWQTHLPIDTVSLKLDCTHEEFMGYVDGSCGKDYAESQYFAFIFPYKWLAKIVGDGNKDFVCSELVATTVNKFKGISFNKELDFVTPKEVLDTIKKAVGYVEEKRF